MSGTGQWIWQELISLPPLILVSHNISLGKKLKFEVNENLSLPRFLIHGQGFLYVPF